MMTLMIMVIVIYYLFMVSAGNNNTGYNLIVKFLNLNSVAILWPICCDNLFHPHLWLLFYNSCSSMFSLGSLCASFQDSINRETFCFAVKSPLKTTHFININKVGLLSFCIKRKAHHLLAITCFHIVFGFSYFLPVTAPPKSSYTTVLRSFTYILLCFLFPL